MLTDARACFRWLDETAARIREEAGHDAARFEALLDDPALAKEALTKFPDWPSLYSHLTELLYFERLLARRGLFPGDRPLTEEETAQLTRRNRELEAEWLKSYRAGGGADEPWIVELERRHRELDAEEERSRHEKEDAHKP